MCGTCATTAAIRGSAAAIATTCPPENEDPQSAIRSGSTPSSARAWTIAARQSACWRRDVDQLPRLPAAVAEVAVVEDEHREPGGGEALRVGGQAGLPWCAPKPWAMTTQAPSPRRPRGR